MRQRTESPRAIGRGGNRGALSGLSPPKKTPGRAGGGCGKQLRLRKGPKRVLHARKYQFAASSPQEARFLASKFPRDTEPADEYVEVDGQRGRTQIGRA